MESWGGRSGFSGLIIEISDPKIRLLKYGIQEIRSLKYGIRRQRNHIRRTARVSPRGRCCCLRPIWVPLCLNPSSAPSNWLDLSFRSPCGQNPAIFYLFKIVGGIFSFLCWAFLNVIFLIVFSLYWIFTSSSGSSGSLTFVRFAAAATVVPFVRASLFVRVSGSL